jgi:hypothetical protein
MDAQKIESMKLTSFFGSLINPKKWDENWAIWDECIFFLLAF